MPEPASRRKTLVLSIDRDDDFGRKASVSSPIVGREANLRAANALALADPEDSDANSVFAAVRTLDRLRAAGHDAEVATICGGSPVGIESDRLVARQLEHVLEATRPDGVIVVSNGADDEQLLPLLQSRAKLDAVERVIVKKAPRLEGLYYLTLRLLSDTRVQRRFVLPLSLALIVWGLAIVTGFTEQAWGATFLVVGLWLLVHLLGWERPFGLVLRGFWNTVTGGPLSLAVLMLSVLVAGYGILLAVREAPGAWEPGFKALFLASFIAAWAPWALAAIALLALGRTADDLLHKRAPPPERWPLVAAGFAFGFLLQALGAGLAAYLRGVEPVLLLTLSGVYGPLLAGVGVAVVGTVAVRRRRAWSQRSA